MSTFDDGVELLVPNGERAIQRPGSAELVVHGIAQGVPSFLAVPGPAGAREALSRALAASAGHRFQRMQK